MSTLAGFIIGVTLTASFWMQYNHPQDAWFLTVIPCTIIILLLLFEEYDIRKYRK